MAAALPALTHHEIVSIVEPFARSGRQVDLPACDRDARRIAFKPMSRDGGLHETLELDCRHAGRFVLERRLERADGLAATLTGAGPDAEQLLAAIDAVPPAQHFREGEGWRLARSYELWLRDLFLSHAELAVEGLRLALTLKLPALRSVAGDIAIRATPGHTLELPDDLLAVLGWDWARLQKKRDEWVSKLRLRGSALRRSRTAEAALERAAPHLVRVLSEPPMLFHQRHLAARWGVVLRRSIPTATALAMIGGALLIPQIFDEPRAAGYWMALHYVPIALLALSFRLQEMSQFEIPRWPKRPTVARWCQPAGTAAHATAR
jgi:hypothetical protein